MAQRIWIGQCLRSPNASCSFIFIFQTSSDTECWTICGRDITCKSVNVLPISVDLFRCYFFAMSNPYASACDSNMGFAISPEAYHIVKVNIELLQCIQWRRNQGDGVGMEGFVGWGKREQSMCSDAISLECPNLTLRLGIPTWP